MPKISPPYLNEGDLVLIVSPSGKVDIDKFQAGLDVIQHEGFQFDLGYHAKGQHFKYAGTHQERLEDLQWALDHPSAKAIFCARGGFGVTHIVDQLDWSHFRKQPKWIIGYSDITALHFAAYNQGYCSIHGPVVQSLNQIEKADVDSLFNLLKGKLTSNKFSFYSTEETNLLRGSEMVGGNLALICNQLGTPTDINFTDKVLFIEEVGEHLYHIDRMVLQLKRAGKLSNLNALLLGEFTALKESKDIFGQDIREILTFHCDQYDYPILFDFPAGHGARNFPFIHGAIIP